MSKYPWQKPAFAGIGLACLALTACGSERDYAKSVPANSLAACDKIIGSVLARKFDDAEALAASMPGNAAARLPLYEKIASFAGGKLPQKRIVLEWREVKELGNVFHVSSFNTKHAALMTLLMHDEFANGDRLAVTCVLSDDGQAVALKSVRVNFLPRALADRNRFFTPEAGFGNYAFLALAIFETAFMLWALFRCVSGPWPSWRWRWLWLLVIPTGFGRFSLDWTTGHWFFLASINLPGVIAGSQAGPYNPIIISFGVPLGAMIFLVLRRRFVDDDLPPTPRRFDE